MRNIFLLLSSFFSLIFVRLNAQPYFPIPAITDTAQFKVGTARTATLLTSASKSNPLEVRILVYGQSISVQDWWKDVKKFVETKFPFARINFINKAIGGFSSERLKITVDNDVVSFYPDLILFHDYGNEPDYEKIIQVIRSRTTSEIVLQTDHMAVQKQEWHDKHCEEWLPMISKKYGLAIIDVRKAWKEYLQQNKLEIANLLADGVHLNKHGNHLMASIINKYFESLRPTTNKSSFVREFLANKDFSVQGKNIEMPVKGNRVDVVFQESANNHNNLTFDIDGTKPGKINTCYYYTRPAFDTTSFFLKKIGQPLAMQLKNDPREEEWKMTIIWADSINQQVGFSIHGSLTGDDGVGRSDSLFTSKSGRIIIEPGSWFRAKEFAKFPWLSPGDVLQWEVKSMCRETITPTSGATTTVIQGINSGAHQLKIKGSGIKQIKAIKVFDPPLQ